jgi:DNA-binding transcriptional LysR family regulator
MDAELLRTFLTVAELGGFSAAGRQLNLTQSAVSLQVKRLEERIGASLFTRTSRSVVLTEAGTVLVPFAQRILRLNGEAEEAISKSVIAQNLRVGMTDEQAVAYLPVLLPAFTRHYPEVRLEVICDQSPQLVEQVHDGLLDIALTIRHPDCNGGTLIGQESLRWVAATGFSVASQEVIPLAVNPDGCVYRASAIAALNRAGRRWRLAFTSANPASTNIAVQAGLGICVKTERALPEGCRLLDSEDGLPPLGNVMVELHVSVQAPTEPVRMIRDLLLQAAGQCRGFSAAI